MSAQAGQIRQLPEQVANKIAAGEVVERPASVVKELLENAVDAGATRIEIEVTAGGRTLVAVHDNGSGMNRADAEMCLQRQATSKIKDVDDIERISTFGFRGEAIPSIASVSRFLIRTRRQGEDVGTEIVVTGGRVMDLRDAGCPAGTTVEVRDLFFNVPARRKFLRAYVTEQARIRACFIVAALAHPGIAMSLKADGREIYRLPGGSSLEDRIADLLGPDIQARMCAVDKTTGAVRVHGWTGIPTMTRTDRAEQYIFINSRPASAAVINYALSTAYPKNMDEVNPVTVLFIDLPPEDVDVNVHPAKREVRFRKPAELREAVYEAVREALEKNGFVKPDAAPETGFMSDPVRMPPPAAVPADPAQEQTFDFSEAPVPAAEGGAVSPWKWFKILGMTGGRYVLLETDTGYVTLDPKAAYERVVYESLHGLAKIESQRLLMPETVQLPPVDTVRLKKFLETAQELGFGISEFGRDCFIVDALPAVLKNVSARELLTALAADLEMGTPQQGNTRWRHESVAKAAAKAAAGIQNVIDERGIEPLIRELEKCRMPYTCPQGRPTMILTSWRELARKFGRE